MTNRTWMLLNAALFVLAGIAVSSLVGLPGELRSQKALTAKAVSGESADAAQPARTTRGAARRGAVKNAPVEDASDTWPAIRRGTLTAIWQKNLFCKERREISATEEDGGSAQQVEDELPAPPSFELVGILAANDTKVAIIELKNQIQQRNARRAMIGRQQPGQAANARAGEAANGGANNFTPTFATAHEEDMLQDTGYKVESIDVEENAVLLSKDGLEYKLKLDRNNASAARRRDSQNAYVQSQQEKSRAATAKAAAAQQTQAAQQAQQQRNAQQFRNAQQGGMPQWGGRQAWGGRMGGQFPNGNQMNGNQMNGNQMNGNQMNGNQMNGNQMNGNQMNGRFPNGNFQRMQNGGQPARQQ